jgi:hypothetical protein
MSDMSMPGFAAGGGLRVGKVLNRSLTILLKGFPKYILFGAVIALPSLIELLIYGSASDLVVDRIGARPRQQEPLDASIAFGLLSFVLYALSQSAMIHGAFQDIRGRRFDLGVSINRGFRRLLPVLGTSICYGFVVVLGFALFIVPGLIILTVYLVAVPVCVVEGLGPIRSLDRSRMLSKGYRWRIFAIYLAPLVGAIILLFVLVLVGTLIAGTIGGAAATFLGSALFSTYEAIVSIVTYHDLRAAKEGLDIEQLAAVFD